MEESVNPCEGMDKRTKAYKECKKKHEGLGDKIEKVTKFIGVKAVVDAITDDCGCDERIAYLNTVGVKAKGCMSDKTKEWFDNFQLTPKVTKENVLNLINAYKEVFHIDNSRMCTSCGNAGRTVRRMYNQLNQYEKASKAIS